MTDGVRQAWNVRRDDVRREIMSMIGVGYQVAKSILSLSEQPPDTFKKIGPSGRRRSMSSDEAGRIVRAARHRIALVDEGD